MPNKLLKTLIVAAIVLNVAQGFLAGLVISVPLVLLLIAGVVCTLVAFAAVDGELCALPVSVTAALVSGALLTVWSDGQSDLFALVSAAIALSIAIVFAAASIMSAFDAIDRCS